MRIDEFEFRNKQGEEIEPTKDQLVIYIKSLHKEISILREQLKKKDDEILKGDCAFVSNVYNSEQEINELKKQLAEKEKEIDEVRSNHANLVADIAYKAVNVYTAESKKTGIPTFYKIHYSQLLKIEDMENLRNYAQDKISFAVEKLEEMKKFFLEEHRDDEMDTDYIITRDAGQIADYLLDQIKQLKEGK